MLLEPLQTAGPLGSTDITLLLRYYGPLRHPLAGPRLPGVAGYTVPFSADFATGRGGLLQLLGASLPSCCRCNPARVSRPISQSANDPCCLRLMKKGSASGIPFRGYVCVHSLRPDDSLTILSMASSIGFQDSVSFLLTIQATGLLTFTLVGLSPTEIRQPSLDTPTCRFIPAHLLSSIARLRFAGRFPSSGGRKLSVNRFLRERFRTGLEGPDKANYQHPGWAKLDDRSGPGRTIKLTAATLSKTASVSTS